MQAVESASEVYSLLLTRRDLCRELLELSRLQIDLINRDDYSNLFKVINTKQELIARWEKLKQEHPNLIENWRDNRKKMSPQELRKHEDVIEDVGTLYEKLLEQEQVSADILALRRDESRQQLKDISQGASVHYAYHEQEKTTTQRLLDVDR